MKKQVLLGTMLLTALNCTAVPSFAQSREGAKKIVRPIDDRSGERRPNRPDERNGRPRDERRDERRPNRPDERDGRPRDRDREERPRRPDERDGRPRDDRRRPDRPRDDRPGWPGHDRPGRPWPEPGRPTPPPERYYEDTVHISAVTRRAGGEWFRLTFRRPVAIENLQILALSAGVKIHEARVHSVFGRTQYIAEMTPSRTFYAGDRVSASYFSYERVQAIDIRAESMGGFADLRVRVISNDDYPRMDVGRF